MTLGVRTLVVWCPDWPLVAVGASPAKPSAVVQANRVVAASAAARELGIARGMRLRAAHSRCPELAVHARDDSREVQEFEPVLGGLESVAALIEVLRPGTCAFAMRGPLHYFSGDCATGPSAEHRVAEIARRAVSEIVGGRCEVRIGVADGVFAAELAARAAAKIHIVGSGETAAFLAPAPVGLLDRLELADVLARLGIRTLGEFAALPSGDVAARFGSEGLAGHRLASGLAERPLDARRPQPDWSVSTEIDPPADRIDRAAFVCRSLADELHRRMAAEGVSCARVAIEAETCHGETSLRVWRHGGELSVASLAARLRWQLDGWLNGPAAQRPSGGIARLSLAPQELAAAKGRQLGFWGGETAADERAVRVAARLQGRLGPAAVKVVERRGGRHPHEQHALVPAAAADLAGRSLVERPESPPWPGSLPAPSPTRLLDPGEPVEVLDATGLQVAVSGRGLLSGPPCRLVAGLACAGRSETLEILGWSGPWPVSERWWDAGARRLARVQVMTDDGVARLLALEQGRWRVTAVWD